MREIRTLRATWRGLETWLWEPDCGPGRKPWGAHRTLRRARQSSTLPFRPRRVVDGHGRIRTGFTPAVSAQAQRAMRQSLRERGFVSRSELSLQEIADWLAPRVRGWMAYYCRFRGSEFQPVADYIDGWIVRWAMRKHKRLRGHRMRAVAWLDRVKRRSPALFPHWCGRGGFAVGTMGAW